MSVAAHFQRHAEKGISANGDEEQSSKLFGDSETMFYAWRQLC